MRTVQEMGALMHPFRGAPVADEFIARRRRDVQTGPSLRRVG